MTTKEEIQTSINSRLKTLPTQIEGGTIQDIVGSVSYELANIIDTRVEVVLDNAFVATADEEHLEMKGKELGIERKDASFAHVVAKITNAAPNALIQTNIRALTNSGLVFKVIEEKAADESGNAYVTMECLTQGTVGNIAKGELNRFQETYINFEDAKITNENMGFDGFDKESVEAYRKRILEYLKDDACNSNIADYIAWAKSVIGVERVVVQDAFKAGAGHVNVYISAVNNQNVSDDLISKVKKTLEAEQIINAIVNVFPLEYFKINISADLTIENGTNTEAIKKEFLEKLNIYLSESAHTVSYLYISNLLFETKGVLDVENYLLNGSNSSVATGEIQVPIAGDIILNSSIRSV